jgi:hypothetical protein
MEKLLRFPDLLMLKILNRILWFVQAVGLCIPPMDVPGFRDGVESR